MKTGHEWLATLPEVYQLQWRENFDKKFAFYSIDEYLEIKHEVLLHFISGSFYCGNTPQGFDYWEDIANGYKPITFSKEQLIEENTYHIVWFDDEKKIHSTGRNYTGADPIGALTKFYIEFPNAFFHSMSIKK